MGKKLDNILGRRFKTSKFKATVALAVSWSAVLKNQRQARCSIARSDVVELLKNGNHESALLRVEQVIKEQNLLDALVVLEAYCHMLIERVNLVERETLVFSHKNPTLISGRSQNLSCGLSRGHGLIIGHNYIHSQYCKVDSHFSAE